jgi:hypothetical protein
MGMAMVRRRIAGYAKVKGKPRPPQRKDAVEMARERARPSAPMVAFAPRQLPPRSWWQKALMPVAGSVGVLVCCGFAYLVFNSANLPSYDYSAETAQYPRTSSSSSSMASSPRRSGQAAAYPGNNEGTGNPVLSNRSTPTDESFRASVYAHKKVSLPKILSGDCVIKAGGDLDIGECLRRQERQ